MTTESDPERANRDAKVPERAKRVEGPNLTTQVPERAKRDEGPDPLKPRWRRALNHPLAHLVYALIVAMLIPSFIVKLYYVTSSSMEPTLMTGDRIFVNRIALLWDQPKTGDIIVFEAGEDWGLADPDLSPLQQLRYLFGSLTGIGPSSPNTLVKRVIATGGQTVSCCDTEGRVMVDGEPLDEPYVVNDFPWEPAVLDCTTDPVSTRCFGEIELQDEQLVVMGDNRVGSNDSVQSCRSSTKSNFDSCERLAESSEVIGFVRE